MKKVYLSLLVIGLVASMSYLVTRAYFTDKKKAVGNTFNVGTLNLQVGSDSGSNIEPFVIEGLGTSEASGTKTWKVKNTGSLPGQFSASFENIKDDENGCNDVESLSDQTCNNPGHDEGDLGKFIKATFFFNNEKKVESLLTSQAAADITSLWANESQAVILSPGQEATLRMDWEMLPEYGNEIQSDSLKFDVAFSLEQVNR